MHTYYISLSHPLDFRVSCDTISIRVKERGNSVPNVPTRNFDRIPAIDYVKDR